jgi:uncharacterized protein (TIGR02268 family)
LFALSSAVLLEVVLLAAPAGARGQSSLPTCESGTRRLELTADASARWPEVCIHSGLSTSFFFDTKLARLELTGRERFRVMESEEGFTLVPVAALPDGERVPVTVYFQDGAAPERVTFELVMHPSEAERQVEVTRHPRTLASYQQGEQQARAEVQRCREEKERLQAECAGQVGLISLLAQGLMGKGGIADKRIIGNGIASPANTLASLDVRTYRSNTKRRKGVHQVVRLAVVMELRNIGTSLWTLADAVLVGGPKHVELKALGVWSQGPILPGKVQHVVVEVEATEEAARSTFALELWSQEGGGERERFDGVTFP